MRTLPWTLGMALLACACASEKGARKVEVAPAPAQAPKSRPAEAILDETVIASQVVERDGMRCLQGLDSYGNVVEESCVALEDRD